VSTFSTAKGASVRIARARCIDPECTSEVNSMSAVLTLFFESTFADVASTGVGRVRTSRVLSELPRKCMEEVSVTPIDLGPAFSFVCKDDAFSAKSKFGRGETEKSGTVTSTFGVSPGFRGTESAPVNAATAKSAWGIGAVKKDRAMVGRGTIDCFDSIGTVGRSASEKGAISGENSIGGAEFTRS